MLAGFAIVPISHTLRCIAHDIRRPCNGIHSRRRGIPRNLHRGQSTGLHNASRNTDPLGSNITLKRPQSYLEKARINTWKITLTQIIIFSGLLTDYSLGCREIY